jgi:hypothetical protein
MKTPDFEGKITKNLSFTSFNYRLTLKSVFSTETFFSLKVSIVLRLEFKHGPKRTDHSTSKRAFYQARHTVRIDG